MFLLSADDPFCPQSFDASPSINALLAPIEESIHQYSQAQTQRRTQAQQWIENKEAKEDDNHKEKIEVSISEDLADGQIDKLDAALKLLSDDELRLLIPSDELEDDEIHIIETQFGAPQGGNHALQEYQRQLLLLEQQNKKRLLDARQEQPNTQETKRSYEEYFYTKQKTKVTNSDNLSPKMPRTRNNTYPRIVARKRKLDDESQEQPPDKAARHINDSDSNASRGLNTDRRELSGVTNCDRTYHLTSITFIRFHANTPFHGKIPCKPSEMLPPRMHLGILKMKMKMKIKIFRLAVPISMGLFLSSTWKLS
jgi:hypothetical protein